MIYGDELHIESVTLGGQYLHCSPAHRYDVFRDPSARAAAGSDLPSEIVAHEMSEVNVAPTPTTFTLHRYAQLSDAELAHLTSLDKFQARRPPARVVYFLVCV